MPSKRVLSRLLPACHLTTVWHQEADDWKLVQWHVSVGVANEEAVSRELTV